LLDRVRPEWRDFSIADGDEFRHDEREGLQTASQSSQTGCLRIVAVACAI